MSPRLIPVLSLALLLGSCVGYRRGGARPSHLQAVTTLSVAVVRNDTQMPRAAAHATNSIIEALTMDGTYRLSTVDRADARLETVLHTIKYRQARATRTDTLRSEELEMVVTLVWVLRDADNPTTALDEGQSSGASRFFVDPNLQTARQTALADALKRASEAVVSRLADGF